MKTLFILVALALGAHAADELYNSKYDTFDVDELIHNDRLLKSYINCFLDTGRCSPDASDFKRTLPDAIETACVKCSEKQKNLIRKTIGAIQEKHPEQWEELVKKNDPQGKHREDFEKFIAEEI